MFTGSREIRNFRIRAWEKLSDNQPSPCSSESQANPNYNVEQCEYLGCAETNGFILDGDGYINTTGLGSFELRQMWTAYANCLGVNQLVGVSEDGAYQPTAGSEWVALPFSRACSRLADDGQPVEFDDDGNEVVLTASPSPFSDCSPLIDFTVCEAFTGTVYCNQEEIWSVEIGALPAESTLSIDGETGRILLERPGFGIESGNRYVSASCSQPYRDFIAEPCKTYFIQVEVDCDESNPQLSYQLNMGKRYSASAGLTNMGGGSGGASGGGIR